MQVDVALQHDGAREPHATWHHQVASALRRQLVDGLHKGIGTKLLSGRVGTKRGERHAAVRNLRRSHLCHREWQTIGILLVRVLSAQAHRHRNEHEQ